jgi:hypothetical protein
MAYWMGALVGHFYEIQIKGNSMKDLQFVIDNYVSNTIDDRDIKRLCTYLTA